MELVDKAADGVLKVERDVLPRRPRGASASDRGRSAGEERGGGRKKDEQGGSGNDDKDSKRGQVLLTSSCQAAQANKASCGPALKR